MDLQTTALVVTSVVRSQSHTDKVKEIKIAKADQQISTKNLIPGYRYHFSDESSYFHY